MRAIISVSDKEGIIDFVRGISRHLTETYASSGTLKLLRDSGIDARNISDLTGFESLLRGRVKTLHPAIFSGILSERDPESASQMDHFGFLNFDLVVANLYPFWKYSDGENLDEIVEHIDIGGVSLIRAAAKNFKHVTVLVDKTDYAPVMEEISSTGSVSESTRKRLAVRAFAETARYDATINRTLSRVLLGHNIPEIPDFSRAINLRYGENPDQTGIMIPDGSGMGIPGSFKMSGKELSYNNIMDSDSAVDTVMEFTDPATVIVKHNTPCGVAVSSSLKESFIHALKGDEESAYGSVIAMNRNLDVGTAEALSKLFVEVIIAPGFDGDSFNILRKKKNLRILKTVMKHDPSLRYRSVSHGILAQSPISSTYEKMEHVAGPKCGEDLIRDMSFAWKVVTHCRSNAIVLAHHGSTVGIGAGQTSRVEAARIALKKAGDKAKGAVMASDGFLPFDDSVKTAAEAGISAIIQPGGSIRDKEVISRAEELSISMYFTGKRVFLH